MTIPIHGSVQPQDTVERIEQAIIASIPDSRVEASGMGGHFEIRVVSAAFAGKSTLAKQRMVLSAIADLMKGEGAPVHAVDRLETVTP
jgi:acid stress-induced BolA-like protein IbaG/YrbA